MSTLSKKVHAELHVPAALRAMRDAWAESSRRAAEVTIKAVEAELDSELEYQSMVLNGGYKAWLPQRLNLLESWPYTPPTPKQLRAEYEDDYVRALYSRTISELEDIIAHCSRLIDGNAVSLHKNVRHDVFTAAGIDNTPAANELFDYMVEQAHRNGQLDSWHY